MLLSSCGEKKDQPVKYEILKRFQLVTVAPHDHQPQVYLHYKHEQNTRVAIIASPEVKNVHQRQNLYRNLP